MKVWKVVHKSRYTHGKLESAVICEAVSYAKNQRTTPQEGWGPLCAFVDFMDAMSFLKRFGTEIWEARAKRSKHEEVWNSRSSTSSFDLPKGTVLCDAITLTKKVWPPEEKG